MSLKSFGPKVQKEHRLTRKVGTCAICWNPWPWWAWSCPNCKKQRKADPRTEGIVSERGGP